MNGLVCVTGLAMLQAIVAGERDPVRLTQFRQAGCKHSEAEIARALTGNTAGAIEDFQAFIESTDSDEGKKQRQGWINALKAGKYPFTPEEIEGLLQE